MKKMKFLTQFLGSVILVIMVVFGSTSIANAQVATFNDLSLNSPDNVYKNKSEALKSLKSAINQNTADLSKYYGKSLELLNLETEMYVRIMKDIESDVNVSKAAKQIFDEYIDEFSVPGSSLKKFEGRLVRVITYQ